MRHGTYTGLPNSKFSLSSFFSSPTPCCDLSKSPVLCPFSESLVGPASLYSCPQGLCLWLPGPGCSCSVFLPVSFMCWVPILPSGSLCLVLVPWSPCLMAPMQYVDWFSCCGGPSLTSASLACKLSVGLWL